MDMGHLKSRINRAYLKTREELKQGKARLYAMDEETIREGDPLEAAYIKHIAQPLYPITFQGAAAIRFVRNLFVGD